MVILTKNNEIIDGHTIYKVSESTTVGKYALWIKWLDAGMGRVLAEYATKAEAVNALMALFDDYKEGVRWSAIK